MSLDFDQYNNSDKTLTYYFGTTRLPNRSRYSHYVLLPIKPHFILNPKAKKQSTLDFDSNEVINFAASTIKSLQNAKNKVYPLPLLTDTQDLVTDTLTPFRFTNCASIIESEKQYIPSFIVVGHGTPSGIGFLDPSQQLSAGAFAEKIDALFKDAQLNLYKRPFHFVFETCNSAYAEVSSQMKRTEVMQEVLTQSFIGKFYNRMYELGFTQITVSGYRGYFCAINSKNIRAARVQDSFSSPTIELDSKQGEYVIHANKCSSVCLDKHLCFPVDVPTPTPTQEIDTIFSRLSCNT